MTIVNKIRSHGYITLAEFCWRNTKRKLLFSSFIASYNFLSKHSNQFYFVTGIKKMEITIAAINYIRKYQLNFCQIVGSKITFGYRPDNSLYLYNTKKILFCSLIEPCQAQTLNFKCTWLLSYLEMYFMLIRPYSTQKTCRELFLELFYLTGLLNSLSN